MESVIEGQMYSQKSSGFGARPPGGFNVLNVSATTQEAAGTHFFEKINRPFLDEVIKRGDDIALATIPSRRSDLIGALGELKGMFSREIEYMIQKGITPKNVSVEKWNEIKGWFK